MNEKPRFPNIALPIAPVLLLTLAHTAAILALLSFVGRVQDYPIHPVGLVFYSTACALTVVGVLVGTFRIQRGNTGITEWVLFSLPAWASLALYAGMWSTPWFGGATYAPYDPGDLDLVWLFNLVFATLFALVALFYSSWRYLGAFFALHIALYLAMDLVPTLSRYPPDRFGSWIQQASISPALGLSAIYGLGALPIALRRSVKPHWPIPGLWASTTLTGFIGAAMLHWLIRWFPRNGDQLGYIGLNTIVPDNAWNWLRPAAEALALVAAGAAILSGAVHLIGCAISLARKLLLGGVLTAKLSCSSPDSSSASSPPNHTAVPHPVCTRQPGRRRDRRRACHHERCLQAAIKQRSSRPPSER